MFTENAEIMTVPNNTQGLETDLALQSCLYISQEGSFLEGSSLPRSSTDSTSDKSDSTGQSCWSDTSLLSSKSTFTNDNPVSSSYPKTIHVSSPEVSGSETHSHSSQEQYLLRPSVSPSVFRAQNGQNSGGNDSPEVKGDQRSTGNYPVKRCKTAFDAKHQELWTCNYVGCSKAFRRIEHLKRHKQT